MALQVKNSLSFSENEEVETHGALSGIGKPSANRKRNRNGVAGMFGSRFPSKFKNGGHAPPNRY
jgi:hypothetical protein